MNQYLHGHHPSVTNSYRVRTVANSAPYLVRHLRHGMSLLDIGSGPGTITADFAKRVAGIVHAVDPAPEAIAMTRATAATAGVQVVTTQADILTMDLEKSFDLVHAHQVLQHLSDPVRALRQMRHHTRPGGLVAAADTDYRAWAWYPASDAMTHWHHVYLTLAHQAGGTPDAGRYLRAWAIKAGLQDIAYTTHTWSYADDESCHWWANAWSARILDSSFATAAQEQGLATQDDLNRMAQAWRDWGNAPGATFIIPHAAILATA